MNPLLSIWTEPKKTLQYLIEHKTIGYGLIILIIANLGSGVMAFADTGYLTGFSLPVILAISFGVILVLGTASYFISAGMYTVIGKMLGGSGNWRDMCLVIAGGVLPMIWTMPLGFIAVLLYGKSLFEVPAGMFAVTNMALWFYLLYTFITMGLGIFSTVILSKGIGLVHNFSSWRGFGTIMIYVGALFVIVFIIAIPVMFAIFLI